MAIPHETSSDFIFIVEKVTVTDRNSIGNTGILITMQTIGNAFDSCKISTEQFFSCISVHLSFRVHMHNVALVYHSNFDGFLSTKHFTLLLLPYVGPAVTQVVRYQKKKLKTYTENVTLQ